MNNILFGSLALFFLCFSHATVQPISYSVLKQVPEDKMTAEQQAATQQVTRLHKAAFYQAVPFDKTAFYAANRFYLGAANQGEEENTLVRAYIDPNDNSIKVLSRTPSQIILNQQFEGGTLSNNPFFNASISHLALLGSNPIFTFDQGTNDPNSNQLACYIDDLGMGIRLLTNTTPLNDAQGLQTSAIVGLGGTPVYQLDPSSPYTSQIFAVVAPNSGSFGDNGSGIALLERGTESLNIFDAQTGEQGNRAAELDSTTVTISGNISFAPTSTPVVMHWDASLQRLFLGLSLQKTTTFSSGGCIALFVGRLEGHTLIIEPLIPLSQTLVANPTQQIVGFFNNASAQDLLISHVATLHSLTSQAYLIVNSGPSSTPGFIYALPLVQQNTSPDAIGKIAQNNDFTQPVALSSQMMLTTDSAALVGGGPLPLSVPDRVTKMFVVGHAVFACLAGDRSTANHEAGMFQSTAIFNAQGNIRAWTPWQRVMGSTNPVFGGGLDTTGGAYWFLTQDAFLNENTIKVTRWGDGEANPGLLGGEANDTSVGLVSILNNQFPLSNGGVHQLFDFGPQTPGFATNQFSLMVATGLNKIALIQTGSETNGIFSPTSGDFSTNLGLNIGTSTAGVVQPFSSSALDSIGPICSCEVSRNTASGMQGWLFVGGPGGLAVLSDPSGNGWDSGNGLSGGFTGITSSFTFKTIGSFSFVRKLVCDGQNLYVLTPNALYRIAMTQTKFAENNTPLLEEIIATPLGVTGFLQDTFSDFAVVGTLGILATSNGLFATLSTKNIQTISNTLPGNNWQEMTTTTGRSLHSICQLFVIPAADATSANIFVLDADFSLDVSVLYLFDVTPQGMQPVAMNSGFDYFFAPGELRTGFFTDGALGFHSRSLHFQDAHFVKRILMLSNPLTIQQQQITLDIPLSNQTTSLGLFTLNSASGSRLIPFNSGIKVHE